MVAVVLTEVSVEKTFALLMIAGEIRDTMDDRNNTAVIATRTAVSTAASRRGMMADVFTKMIASQEAFVADVQFYRSALGHCENSCQTWKTQSSDVWNMLDDGRRARHMA